MQSKPIWCLILLVVVPGASRADDNKALQGTWLPSAAELATQKMSEEMLKTMRLTIKGDQYEVQVGKQTDRGTVKFDPAQKPKTMDIMGTEGPNKGRKLLAIYEINGDTLRVCYALAGDKRPTAFTSRGGTTPLFLVTYKRQK